MKRLIAALFLVLTVMQVAGCVAVVRPRRVHRVYVVRPAGVVRVRAGHPRPYRHVPPAHGVRRRY